jgi:hypothetical protein
MMTDAMPPRTSLLGLVLNVTILLGILSVIGLAVLFVVLAGVIFGGIWVVLWNMASPWVRLLLACLPFCYVALLGRPMTSILEGGANVRPGVETWGDQWPANV